jgi:hypothetical protein
MIDIRHPFECITAELVEITRDTAGESEKLKQLHPLQLKMIHE